MKKREKLKSVQILGKGIAADTFNLGTSTVEHILPSVEGIGTDPIIPGNPLTKWVFSGWCTVGTRDPYTGKVITQDTGKDYVWVTDMLGAASTYY